jgi:C2H2-type zinc finger
MSNLHLISLCPPSASASSSETNPATIKPKRMKKIPNPSSTHTSNYKSNNVSPCTECGKQFNTWKALFGHMRCHPERQWRGMTKKSKPKLKPKPKQKQQDWTDNMDEVTKAALILMQMSSGWSFCEVFALMESSRRRKMKNLDIDLNLPPPAEED